ncbi:MAG TPA: TIGR01906 family membrane protein [Candidatus Merdenecus merdavium]|nr:TIGR01906 family membrane protein [Candidatus Merdenecus merdavium]
MTFAFVMVLLITSFEIATYSDFSWYQKEYEKYNVLDDLNMKMEDVMYVTHEMMDYLKGKREDLVVYTTVGDHQQEFFNEREKSHMLDVQVLFIKGIQLRRVAVMVCIAGLLVYLALKGSIKTLCTVIYRTGTGILLGITALLGLLFATDFTKYFTIFHKIFFTNDLWLLDPATDLMINMLPEGFFGDMAFRILVIFVSFLVVTLGLSFCFSIVDKRKQNN